MPHFLAARGWARFQAMARPNHRNVSVALWWICVSVPPLLLHLQYLRPPGTPAWASAAAVLSAILGAQTFYLGALRSGGVPGVAIGAVLNSGATLFLGGYAQVFTDFPSLVTLIRQGREALEVRSAWVLFVPWALLLVIPLTLAGLAATTRFLTRPKRKVVLGLGLAWLCLLVGIQAPNLDWGPEASTARRVQMGFLAASALDTWQIYQDWDDRTLVDALHQDRATHPPATLRSATPFQRKTLIIQLESLDLQALGRSHRGRPVLPFLTALSKDVPPLHVEPNHVGPSGSAGSDFQVLTGLRPHAPKPVYTLNRMDWEDSLPGRLQRRGIPFVALHGNRADFWSRDRAFRRMGMVAFLSQDDILRPRDARWGVSDHATFRKALEVAHGQNGPLVLFVITLSSHVPFDLVPPDTFPGNGTLDRLFNSLAYLDRELARFLKDLPRTEPWTVVMYGDHASRVRTDGYDSLTGGREQVPCWVFDWGLQGPEPRAFRDLPVKLRTDGSLELASLCDFLDEGLMSTQ